MDNNGYPDQDTFAIRLRETFLELARREETSNSYDAAAVCYRAPYPTWAVRTTPQMSSDVTPIDAYRRRRAAVGGASSDTSASDVHRAT